MRKLKGWDLNYFNTGEWQVVQERLDDLDKAGKLYNPPRHQLFAALDAVPFDSVRVAVFAQDPYPDRAHSTGVAFSIPKQATTFPPTLNVLFEEYSNDLHLPRPTYGNLDRWSDQGILLWNTVPSCLSGQPLSHDWTEWRYLTEELIKVLSGRGVVFWFCGSISRRNERLVPVGEADNNRLIVTAHPASERYRKNILAKHLSPLFLGTRPFTTINGLLCDLGQKTIDWRLA